MVNEVANVVPSLLGKRKKLVPKCANPLFVRWLTEWRDEAKEKGWNSYFTYSKALSSLKKYPLPFATGQDCKILEFFGDKLCKMLDSRLNEHTAEFGDSELHDDEIEQNSLSPNKRPRAREGVHDLVTVDGDAGKAPILVPTKKPGRSRREYIPAYRSAPYALLHTLYQNYQSPHSRGYMTKKELSDEAQPLADKSLSVPDPGSRFSGWSSMGSLIKKHYVFKEGNPAKYSITEIGIELARKMMAADGQPQPGTETGSAATFLSSFSSSESSSNELVSLSVNANFGFDKASTSSYDRNDVTSVPGAGLQFTYVDETGADVMSKELAEVMIHDELGVGFLIRCRYSDLLMCPKRYQLDHARCRDGQHVYAYVHNDDAEEYSNPQLGEMTSSRVVTSSEKAGPSSLLEYSSAAKNHNSDTKFPSNLPDRLAVPKSKATVGQIPQSSVRSFSSYSGDISPSKDSQDSIASSAFAAEPFILDPGQYSIVLCVDNREHFGHAGSSKQNLLPELTRNGVLLDVRNLSVGDFLWIAKEKVPIIQEQLNQPDSRELVLDWIIERKRMDDLCSSIKDGRFREQKFRLRNCGLRRPTYLVEAYGSAKNLGIPEDSLNQAIINSQIIDNFHIKNTRDQKETVAYLTVMSRQLQRKFANRSLISCSRNDLEQYDNDLHHFDRPLRLLTFAEFNKLNVKNQSLSVRDMFAKQLMTISGMSHDKTAAIVRHFSGPRALVRAYGQCASEKERENLLSNVKFGQSNRNVGSALSRLVYLLYNNRQLT